MNVTKRPSPVLLLALLSCVSCARHPGGSFHVLPAKPDYLLRSPDSRETPFPEVRNGFTRSGQDWVELRPGMELRFENAYYKEGSVKRDLASYLGTQLARYQVRSNGIRLAAIESSVTQTPKGQPSIPQLVGASRDRYYRFFYEILFNRRAALRGAVLLSAGTQAQLDRLTTELMADPTAVCSGRYNHCKVFPETCVVSLEMEVVVNGTPQNILWGGSLAAVAARHRHVEVWRRYRGRLTPVEMDSNDVNALRLPLLPGDQVKWSD